jgi:hypothetical protein
VRFKNTHQEPVGGSKTLDCSGLALHGPGRLVRLISPAPATEVELCGIVPLKRMTAPGREKFPTVPFCQHPKTHITSSDEVKYDPPSGTMLLIVPEFKVESAVLEHPGQIL